MDNGVMANGRKPKGKNFSGNHTVPRNKGDFYQTPYSMTKLFLDTMPMIRRTEDQPDYNILEPASGDGAICQVLQDEGYYDRWSYDLKHGTDYLKETIKFKYVITNPPFSLANEFIEKSYEVAKYKFFLLLPLDYLHGLKRYKKKLFRALSRVDVFVRKPMLSDTLRDDGKYSTGMLTYAWYTFDLFTHPGHMDIGWLDNSGDVIGERKDIGVFSDDQLNMILKQE